MLEKTSPNSVSNVAKPDQLAIAIAPEDDTNLFLKAQPESQSRVDGCHFGAGEHREPLS